MGNVIQFPVKKRPPTIELDRSNRPITETDKQRLERIRESLQRINALMADLNKKRGIDYDIFED